ncbi:V-type proton ATPase subunit G [Glycine soja]|uniref:V-type proton ATPase subunit G n=1 Tax=Glycine soja TaxID=3848 RepID=A0A0B2QG15_GLYSO|nr:V-type proton ATPase subunit G [Glycine soja]
MDPFKGQGGIQMLLIAEQEAQHIVSNARNLRTQRLKQAKDEVEREAAQYRSHMEDEYQKLISENTGSSGSNVKRLEEETDAKIKNLKKSTSKISSEVVDMLLNLCKTTMKCK